MWPHWERKSSISLQYAIVLTDGGADLHCQELKAMARRWHWCTMFRIAVYDNHMYIVPGNVQGRIWFVYQIIPLSFQPISSFSDGLISVFNCFSPHFWELNFEAYFFGFAWFAKKFISMYWQNMQTSRTQWFRQWQVKFYVFFLAMLGTSKPRRVSFFSSQWVTGRRAPVDSAVNE